MSKRIKFAGAYMAPLVTKPEIINGAGRYLTRCGEVVSVTELSSNHDFGNRGTYSNGVREGWHKSGRLYAGVECANDIMGRAPMSYLVEMLVGATWIPVLDGNDAEGTPVQTRFTEEAEALALMRFLGVDPDFGAHELRVVESVS